ncbi:ANTAR domain-containing protein [Streptomyces cyanogenus]|uniref:ANTAR domain protein n=1 Tax=Streptomyces cyanogenus TaxID=80860 RepID=A0ABX7U685_STRCY|nr:ANTAR domain-containing protein [Streptomyces cyanogenus]QTE02795.1 ANTAR domain protein [Streptomyces cyanogenus]
MIAPDEQADHEQVKALQDEVDQLRQALVSHALVDQAIGVVITLGGLRPEQGWEALKHMSQHTNVKLREVARCLVEWPARRKLPEVIRRALPAAVEHARGQAAADAWKDRQEVGSGRPG